MIRSASSFPACCTRLARGRPLRQTIASASAVPPLPPPAKRVLVALADGCEDVETASVVDVCRRAGLAVTLASVEPGRALCTLSRGLVVQADALLDDAASAAASAAPYDLVALPGGMPGAERLAASAALRRLLVEQHAAGRLVAALCASPTVVLLPLGLLAGRAATAHPAFSGRLVAAGCPAASVAGRVVRDGHLITSRGPGTSLEFALCCVESLLGKEDALKVAAPMVLPPPAAAGGEEAAPHEWRL